MKNSVTVRTKTTFVMKLSTWRPKDAQLGFPEILLSWASLSFGFAISIGYICQVRWWIRF